MKNEFIKQFNSSRYQNLCLKGDFESVSLYMHRQGQCASVNMLDHLVHSVA